MRKVSAAFILILIISACERNDLFEFSVDMQHYGGTAVTGVTLNKASTALLIGGSEQLYANILPDSALNKTVIWNTSDGTIVGVDDTGLITGIAPGITEITATTEDGGYSDICEVTVSAQSIAVSSVELLPVSVSIDPGSNQQLTAAISPADATNQNVTFHSSNTGIAQVSSSGIVTGISAGTVTITVTTIDGSYNAFTTVTVPDCEPPMPGGSGLISASDIQPYSLMLNWGPAADNQTPQSSLQYAVYMSESIAINTVEECELYGTIIHDFTAGLSGATAQGLTENSVYNFNVIVRDSAGNKSAYQMKSEVTAAAPLETIYVNSVILDPGTINIYPTQTYQLNVMISPADATNKSVAFISADTNVAQVSPEGLVTAISAGTTNVKVTTVDGPHEAFTTVVVMEDTEVPVPGASGLISTTGLLSDKITLSWEPAADNVTIQTGLEYAVYKAESPQISSVTECEAYGTLIHDYSSGLTMMQAINLLPNTNYKFNVIVRDSAGNRSAYAMTTVTTPSASGWIEQTGSGIKISRDIICNDDGTFIAAATYNDFIYTSSDGGTSWTAKTNSGQVWSSISSSNDGSKLFALVNGGFGYISDDAGATWIPTEQSRWWSSTFSSADGSVLIGTAESFGNIFHKTIDRGVNWSPLTINGADYLLQIKGSEDGQTLICGSYNGNVFISYDFGTTWSSCLSLGTGIWTVASSATGNIFVAASSVEGYINISTDSGATWQQSTGAGNRKWARISISGDGTKIAAVVSNGYIYTSFDSGTTWVEHTDAGLKEWSVITISKLGTKIIAAVSNGYIYTYEVP